MTFPAKALGHGVCWDERPLLETLNLVVLFRQWVELLLLVDLAQKMASCQWHLHVNSSAFFSQRHLPSCLRLLRGDFIIFFILAICSSILLLVELVEYSCSKKSFMSIMSMIWKLQQAQPNGLKLVRVD